MRINVTASYEVPEGTPLAKVTDDGTLWLWPMGVGIGPAMMLDEDEWVRLRNSADSALRVHKDRNEEIPEL